MQNISSFIFLWLKRGVIYIILPIGLWFLTYSHAYPLFSSEFTQHFGSIEISYIQMAKFITSSLPQFAWQSRWYLGYPLTVLYTPLVPFAEVLFHWILGYSFSHAYRVVTAIGYCATVISLFWFLRILFKNTVAALVSVIPFGVLPSVMAFLSNEVAADRFAKEFIEPRRFTILVRWGEGPHIVSLFFLPLAALFLVLFLRYGKKHHLIFGAIFSGLVALTNSVGAWGFALLAFCICFGVCSEQSLFWKQTIARFLAFTACSYALIAWWFNPFFLSNFFREGGSSMQFWKDQFPWGFLIIAFFLAVYFFISKKVLARFWGVSAIVLYAALMFGLVNTYYASGGEKLELVPQVLRLTVELDFAAYALIGAAVTIIGGIILGKDSKIFSVRHLIYLFVMTLAVASMGILYPTAKNLSQELPQYAQGVSAEKLKERAEYLIAQKLVEKVTGDERVFVPGNYSFYFNYFTDVPQLRGALFQSAIHPWAEHIYFQMVTGKQSDISLAWLKIANIGWLVFNGPREMFGDFKIPSDKFDETLTLDEETEGDKIYQVPLTDSSLAKAVSSDIFSVKKPENAIDKEPILKYASILDGQQNKLTFKNIHNGGYEISGKTDEKEIILVQQTYVSGWSARDQKHRKLEVQADPLGFIAITPKEAGEQLITLTYSSAISVLIGKLVSVVSIIGIVILVIKGKSPLIIVEAQKKKEAEEKEY